MTLRMTRPMTRSATRSATRPATRCAAASAVLGALLLAGCQGSEPQAAPSPSTFPVASTSTVTTVTSAAPSATTGAPSSPASSPSRPAAPSGTGAGDPEQIPDPYRGSWNLSPQDCGTESEGRLEIEADRITFYESRGEVTRLSREGEILTTVLALTGEGTSWTETYRWQLSADGAQLTELGTGSVRRRCPGS